MLLIFLLLPSLVCLSTACGGTKLLHDPQSVKLDQAMVQADDQQIKVSLNWVILRDGVGSWAKNADWDEYLISISNQTDNGLQIKDIHVIDSLGRQLASNSDRKQLVIGSRETIELYRHNDIEIRADQASGAMITAGVAAGYIASEALALGIEAALLGGTAATGATVVAASMALILVPVLIVGGIVQGINNNKVADEIIFRHTPMPAELAANETLQLDLFFPLAPSPRQIDIAYIGPQGEKVISIDTTEVLQGLHIVSVQNDENIFSTTQRESNEPETLQ